MITPPLNPDEEQRLESLRSYRILDTLPDRELDRITELATQILGIPSAIISLVDRDRQWFKSKCGVELNQTSRAVSFCAHVVSSREPLLVSDAREDERFFDNPLVVGPPYIRFYFGVPLLTPDHHILGTLCVLDSQPRSITQDQVSQLSLLVELVMSHLELRRKNLELNRQKREVKLIFDQLQAGVVITDERGEVTDHNQRAEELLSVTRGVSLSQALSALALLDDGGGVILEDDLPSELSRRRGVETHRRLFKCAEAERWFMISSTPLGVEVNEEIDEGMSGEVDGEVSGEAKVKSRRGCVEADISYSSLTHINEVSDLVISQRDNMRFKRKLADQDRFVTVGTLAAGVGHEINNPLSYISANTDYISELLSELNERSSDPDVNECCSEVGEVLEEVKEGANRISQIVSGLSVFARSSEKITPVDLHKILRLSIQMTRHIARPTAQVFPLYADEPLWVLGEQSRLSQVCVNLILNALQAFERQDPKENLIVIRTRLTSDRSQVIVEIRDNGPGIPLCDRDRIFDPFFTTRLIGEGSGLGLSIAQQNLNHLRGSIWFESFRADESRSSVLGEVERSFINIFNQRVSGADFYFSLPLVSDDEAGDLLKLTPTPTPVDVLTPSTDLHLSTHSITRSKRSRVLLIDDEIPLLRAFERLLAPHVELTTLSDPRLAVETCLEATHPYDLILCDVMMPHLNGVEVYHSLLQSGQPYQGRFVFVTGGVTQEQVYEGVRSAQCPLLLKPLKLDDVLTLLARLAEA